MPDSQAPDTKNQYNIPLFGIISVQQVEPQLCTLEGESKFLKYFKFEFINCFNFAGFSEFRLNKSVQLIIQSRDADNLALCHGGLHLMAVIKYKESGKIFMLEVIFF